MDPRAPTAERRVFSTSKARMRGEFARYLAQTYDLKRATAVVQACTLDNPPAHGTFHVGVVYGPSGTGKTTALRRFQPQRRPLHAWRARQPVFQQVGPTPRAAEAVLLAVSMNNVPDWMQPFENLSTGQQARANVARALAALHAGDDTFRHAGTAEPVDDVEKLRGGGGARRKPKKNQKNATSRAFLVIDEFGSALDDASARALAHRLQRHARRHGLSVVVATNRASLLPYLRPDWVLDTQECAHVPRPRWPRVALAVGAELLPTRDMYREWDKYARFHYLSHSFGSAAKVFRLTCNGETCGFQASIRHMNPANLIFAHRTVVRPEYQGFGIGDAVHNLLGAYVKSRGMRFRVHTSHPKVRRAMRAQPKLWKTLFIDKVYKPYASRFFVPDNRKMNAFEYVGPPLPEKDLVVKYRDKSDGGARALRSLRRRNVFQKGVATQISDMNVLWRLRRTHALR